MSLNILIVEDDPLFAADLRQALRRLGHSIRVAGSQSAAKLEIKRKNFDVALIDLMLPPDFSRSGIEVLRMVREKCGSTHAVLMSTRETHVTEIVADSMVEGASYFFDKNSESCIARITDHVQVTEMSMKENVFVSHGHDELAKLKVKDFLSSQLGKAPIILSEQASKGLTVVEKLEAVSSRCCFAIILLTKDDATRDGGMRARQNVIHEVGFFQGKYGRERVLLLCERGVEIFSNISGIIRVDYESGHIEEVFEVLRVELEAAGLLKLAT
jgi:predicted nucleotide-binding protein